MKLHTRIAALIAVALCAPPIPAVAQATAAPAACTYQSCGLRAERGFWGARLVRGASGEKIGGYLGNFGKGAEVLLESPSDSARAYGRSYISNSRRSGWLGLVAGAGYIVVLSRTDNLRHWDQLGNEGAAAAIGVGIFGIASGIYAGRAGTDLSRGVWWYNSALPR